MFQFPSDIKLAAHPEIHDKWVSFGNQTEWNEYYAREYVRLSLLSVPNINNLTECTKVLPPRQDTFNSPDKPWVTKWLNAVPKSDKLGPYMADAVVLTTSLLQSLGVSTSS